MECFYTIFVLFYLGLEGTWTEETKYTEPEIDVMRPVSSASFVISNVEKLHDTIDQSIETVDRDSNPNRTHALQGTPKTRFRSVSREVSDESRTSSPTMNSNLEETTTIRSSIESFQAHIRNTAEGITLKFQNISPSTVNHIKNLTLYLIDVMEYSSNTSDENLTIPQNISNTNTLYQGTGRNILLNNISVTDYHRLKADFDYTMPLEKLKNKTISPRSLKRESNSDKTNKYNDTHSFYRYASDIQFDTQVEMTQHKEILEPTILTTEDSLKYSTTDLPVYVEEYTNSSLTFPECLDKLKIFTFKISKMNTSIQRALEFYESNYERYYNGSVTLQLQNTNNSFLFHTDDCKNIEQVMEYHLKDIEHFKAIHQNCRDLIINITDGVSTFMKHLSRLKNVCDLYEETQIVLALHLSVYEKLLYEFLPAYNKSGTVKDVFTYREYMSSYNELYNITKTFAERERKLHRFIEINNFTDIVNETLIHKKGVEIEILLNAIIKEKSSFEELDETREDVFYIIRVPLYSVILIIGLIGNCCLMIIFALEREIRTRANILIFNLALADALNLITNIVPHLITEFNSLSPFINYGEMTCKVLTVFAFLSIGLSVWTVPALAVQRYIIIFNSMRAMTGIGCISHNTLSLIYVSSVWIFATGLCIPIALNSSISTDGLCTYSSSSEQVLYRLLVYGGIPMLIVAIFYKFSARYLARSARNMPGETSGQNSHKEDRYRSARVLQVLTIVFAFSYIPYFLFSCLIVWEVFDKTVVAHYVISFLFFLLYVNSAVNPIALYISSSVYRVHFNKYLLIKCNSPREGPQINNDFAQIASSNL